MKITLLIKVLMIIGISVVTTPWLIYIFDAWMNETPIEKTKAVLCIVLMIAGIIMSKVLDKVEERSNRRHYEPDNREIT